MKRNHTINSGGKTPITDCLLSAFCRGTDNGNIRSASTRIVSVFRALIAMLMLGWFAHPASATLVVDVRVSSVSGYGSVTGPKSVVGVRVGDSITMDIWAQITTETGTGAFGLGNLTGSILTSQYLDLGYGNNVHGTMQSGAFSPVWTTGAGYSLGTVQNVNHDGNPDLGASGTTLTLDFIRPAALSLQTVITHDPGLTVNPLTDGWGTGYEFYIGSVSFLVTSINNADDKSPLVLNWDWNTAFGPADSARAINWVEGGTSMNGVSRFSTSIGQDVTIIAGTPSPDIAYWLGGVIPPAPNSWNDWTGGNSNWVADYFATSPLLSAPGPNTDVYFSAMGASNTETVLTRDFEIADLNIISYGYGMGIASKGNLDLGSVVIDGTPQQRQPNVAVGQFNNTLTISSDSPANGSSIWVEYGAPDTTISANLVLTGNNHVITVDNFPYTAPGLTLSGSIDAPSGLVKKGFGTLLISGSGDYTAETDLYEGALAVNGAIAQSPVYVDGGPGYNPLSGTGVIGHTTVAGAIAPGYPGGTLRATSLYLSDWSTFVFNYNTPEDYGQVQAESVWLERNTNLELSSFGAGPIPVVRSSFTIIDNTGSDPIQGGGLFWSSGNPHFEGDLFGANGRTWQITYQGGTGNDVVLTQLGCTADLASLTIGTGTFTPGFSSDVTDYYVTVPGNVTAESVVATPVDPNASVQILGASPLVIGDNTITIQVTSDDGTVTKIYTIHVTRLSNIVDLSALLLSVAPISPAFTVGGTSYSATVLNTDLTTTVTAVVADPTATIQARINGGAFTPQTSGVPSDLLSLALGLNGIDVLVTAQDGTQKTYHISVTRPLSSNANLQSLTISTGILNPGFDPATTFYAVTVGTATTSENVLGIPQHPGAHVVYSNTSGFVMGLNMVRVTVTAEDGVTKKVYTIFVTMVPSNANLTNLTVSPGTLSPYFTSGNPNYNVSLHYYDTSIVVTPTISDPLGTLRLRINNGAWVSASSGRPSAALPLLAGTNPINVEVTAQDMVTKKTYTVNVTRSMPWVVNGLATNLQSDGATLNGVAYMESVVGALYFRYGSTTAFTSGTVPANLNTTGTNVTSGTLGVFVVSPQLQGLAPSTTYHYQLFATTSLGEISDATDSTFTTLPASSQPVITPLATGSTGNPVINALGHVAIVTPYRHSTGEIRSGLFAEIAGRPLSLILSTRDVAPGTVGAIYGTLADPVFNAVDSLAFHGFLPAGYGDSWSHADFCNCAGLWIVPNGVGPAVMLARLQATAPLETPNSLAVFGDFHSLVMSDNNEVIFTCTIKGPGVYSTNNEGIWRADASGNVRLVIRTGDNTLVGGRMVTALDIIPAPLYGSSQTHSIDPASRNLVFMATFDDSSKGIFNFVYDASGNVVQRRQVMRSGVNGTVVPGVWGSNYSSCIWIDGQTGEPILNGLGHVALSGTFLGPGRTYGKNSAVFAELGGASLAPVVQAGDYAPGTSPVITATGANYTLFYTLSDPMFNNRDGIAFVSKLIYGDASANVRPHFDNTYGIFAALAGPSSLKLVARQEGSAPGTPGWLFASFTDVVLPDVGGPIFMANLKDTAGVARGNGVFVTEANGNIKPIIWTNSTTFIPGKTVSAITMFKATALTTFRRPFGQNRSFDAASGKIVFNVTFTDGSSKIYKVQP